jgi:hypothetical protein
MTTWLDPITWTGGQLVTEAQLNTYIKDNMNYLFNLAGSANQNAGGTYINLDPANSIPFISGVTNAPITQVEAGTTNPIPNDYVASFIGTSDYYLQWQGRWPSSAGTSVPHAKGNFYMGTAVAGSVVFGVQVAARSVGDAKSNKVFGAVNLGTVACPGTAGLIAAFDITLTNNDSISAGDSVNVLLYRYTGNAADTAGGTAFFRDGEVK